MNLARLLDDSTLRRSDHPAIVFRDEILTYQALNARVQAACRGLRRAGLRPGDVCVVMMPNSIDWVTVYYAIARMGAVVVPVNFLYRTHELAHIFKDSRASAFIGHAAHLDYAGPLVRDSRAIKACWAAGGHAEGFLPFSELLQEEGPFPIHPAQDDDTLAIIYTSGTTGVPKGAMLTHHSLSSNATTVADMRYTEPHDVCLGVLPFFHIYGQTSTLNASLYLGLTIRLWEHFEPEPVFTAIEAEENSILIAVPTIFNRLAEMAARKPPVRSSLRFCVSGGASLPVEVLRRFEQAFHVTIYEGYGLTECSPVCVENPYGRKTKPGSIGLPIPGFEARIVDQVDREVPRGDVGELVVKGPGVMKGYLDQPEATAETLRGGWLHTGDLARQDEEGYIFIVDRKKDMVIRGGYNVYPREIEEVLYGHPAVLEAAVLGVPHHDLGEEVAAVVTLREGHDVSPEDLREWVKARVAPYKYPRIVRIVGELPKTTTGKVLKRAISVS